MKRKISVQLSEQVAARLEAAAERPGANRSAIVEAALDRFLDGDHERVDDVALSRRLNWMSRQPNPDGSSRFSMILMPTVGGHVLGSDLNCSESAGKKMCEHGQTAEVTSLGVEARQLLARKRPVSCADLCPQFGVVRTQRGHRLWAVFDPKRCSHWTAFDP